MTPQLIVGIGVRLFAVWLAVAGAAGLGSFFAALSQPSTEDAAGFALIVPVIYCFLAAGLWLFPMSVAHRLVPKTRFENVLSVAPLELARVGSALLGLWLLARSIPWLGAVVTRILLFEAHNASFFNSLPLETKFYLAEETFRLFVGVALVFGSARIAELLAKSREQKSNETNPDL